MLARQVTVSSQRIPAVHQTSNYPPQPSINPEPQPIPTPLEPTFSPINEPSGSADDFSPPPADFFDPAEAFAAIPERIGYLKEVCGLDFGWGSSSLMEWMVEHIHIYGDISWGTSIILLAILSRLVIFYPAAQSSNMAAINNAMLPVAGPIRQRMGAAWKSGDRAEIQVCKAQLSVLNKKYGFSTWKMFIPVLIQVPIQFGGFRVMRNMAELPVPALVKENWLWTQDLTLGDPYFILPVANAIIIYMTIKVCISPLSAIILSKLTLLSPHSEEASPATPKSTTVSCWPCPTSCPVCPSSS
jgi:membrane protein insertase Oxa1/YidC/SpoIIIJ